VKKNLKTKKQSCRLQLDQVQHQHIEVANEGKQDDDDDDDEPTFLNVCSGWTA
jgi:hypothetical protein